MKNKSFFLIILLFLAIALLKINWLGLQYDEVLFANVARGIVDESIVFKKIGSLPVMLMPYMGALKAYLYFLILKIFGTSVISVRLPMIILTIFSLYFIYKSLEYFFSKKIALLSSLLLVLNPSFVSFNIFDVGPSALEMFFKTGIVFLISKYLKNKYRNSMLGIVLLSLLGLYNKVNFIWFLVAFVLAFLLVSKNPIKLVRKYLYIGLIPLLAFLYIFIKSKLWLGIGIQDFETRIPVLINWIESLISGNLFFDYLGVWKNQILSNMFIFVWLGIVVFALINKLLEKRRDRKYMFVFYFLIMMFFQLAITQRAANPWHIFALEPFITIFGVLSIDAVFKNKYLSMAIFVVVLIYFAGNNLSWFVGQKRNYKNIMWSKSIGNLVEYAKGSNKRFISLDWGFHNQFLLMDPVKGKYEQIWGPLITGDLSKKEIEELSKDPNILYVAFTNLDSRWGIMSASNIWLEYNRNKKIEVVKEFFEGDKMVIRIYKIK